MSRIRIAIPKDRTAEFCKRWLIKELSVFGSVLRDDFKPDSDVDVLATFAPKADWSLFDHAKMQDELSKILGRAVHLLTKRSVERSKNWIRKQAILDGAEVVYAA
jgi:predicted nucleotidyltransferase